MATKVVSSQGERANAEFLSNTASYAQAVRLNAGHKDNVSSASKKTEPLNETVTETLSLKEPQTPDPIKEESEPANVNEDLVASCQDLSLSDCEEELEDQKEKSPAKVEFVEAPPPKVNPWMVNKNAASVIVGKKPSSKANDKVKAPPKKSESTHSTAVHNTAVHNTSVHNTAESKGIFVFIICTKLIKIMKSSVFPDSTFFLATFCNS